jgi:hypothetical protein
MVRGCESTIAAGCVGRAVLGIEQTQERIVGGAELALPGHQVVVAAVDGAQAKWHLAVGQQVDQAGAIGVGFGDEDLLEDELQVGLAEIGHFRLTSIGMGASAGRRRPSRLFIGVHGLQRFLGAKRGAQTVTRRAGYVPGVRTGWSGAQARRTQALGGPGLREVGDNVL